MLTSSVDVLWTARYDYKRNWKLVPHEHDHFQMIYFLAGSGCLFLENREYSIQPGDLFLIKPHKSHGLAPDSIVKTLDLKFLVHNRGLYRALLTASDRISGQDAMLTARFEQIRLEGERRLYLYRESCNLLLLQILLHYLRDDTSKAGSEIETEPDQAPPNDIVVRKVIDYIKTYYSEDLNLTAIAASVQRSDRHVRQRFEDCLGMPPKRYLAQYRITKAKELIQYSDLGLKDIAKRVGFKTIHHFTRVFHETVGESPGAWRRRYQQGICKDVCIEPAFLNVNWTFPNEDSETLARVKAQRTIDADFVL